MSTLFRAVRERLIRPNSWRRTRSGCERCRQLRVGHYCSRSQRGQRRPVGGDRSTSSFQASLSCLPVSDCGSWSIICGLARNFARSADSAPHSREFCPSGTVVVLNEGLNCERRGRRNVTGKRALGRSLACPTGPTAPCRRRRRPCMAEGWNRGSRRTGLTTFRKDRDPSAHAKHLLLGRVFESCLVRAWVSRGAGCGLLFRRNQAQGQGLRAYQALGCYYRATSTRILKAAGGWVVG